MRFFLFCAFCLCAFVPLISNAAGWVDDWIDEKTETSPGYFEGQKRGYYTGGSFSARKKSNNDYPFTFMAPRLKVGCGGIDAYMGGFSFMNAEYLVEKGQRILQSAPAAAFDIALNTLCVPCINVLNSLEALSNQLNSLQLDDCKAAKGVIATIADKQNFYEWNEQQRNGLHDVQANFQQSTGAKDLYQGITQDLKSLGNKATINSNVLLSECSADIKDLFKPGSMISNIGIKIGVNSKYIDLIRGMFGDVDVVNDENQFNASPVDPCEENKKFDLETFVQGKPYEEDDIGICSPISDTKTIAIDIENKMKKVADGIKNKTKPTADDYTFLNVTPVPVTLILKNAIGTGQEDVMKDKLIRLSSYAYGYSLMKDLYLKTDKVFSEAEKLIVKQGNSTTGMAVKCDLSVVKTAIQQIGQMHKDIKESAETMSKDYSTILQGIDHIDTFLARVETFDSVINKNLSDSVKTFAFHPFN